MKREEKSYHLVHLAYKALKRGNALEAIAFLERAHDDPFLKDNPHADYLLCIAYLMYDKLPAAATIVRDAERLYPEFKPFQEILAFLALKSCNSLEEAVMAIVKYETAYPASKKIRALHKRLRSISNFASFQKEARLKTWIKIHRPTEIIEKAKGRHKKRKVSDHYFDSEEVKKAVIPVRAIALVGSLLVVTVLVLLFRERLFSILPRPKDTRSFEEYRLDSIRYPLVDTEKKESPYSYSDEKSLLSDYEEARLLIKDGAYNQATVLLNRILLSNVNISVKDRVLFLKSFISSSENRNYETVTFEAALHEHELYRGYFVWFAGKVANLREQGASAAFSLLVNEKGSEFDGIVEVVCEHPLGDILNGSQVKVEGELLETPQGSKSLILRSDKVKRIK